MEILYLGLSYLFSKAVQPFCLNFFQRFLNLFQSMSDDAISLNFLFLFFLCVKVLVLNVASRWML